MENSGIESLVDLIERIEINEENREQIKEIKKFIEEENYVEAINLLKKLKSEEKIKLKEIKEPKEKVFEEEFKPEDEETEENELGDLDYRKDLAKITNSIKNSKLFNEVKEQLAPETPITEEKHIADEMYLRNVGAYNEEPAFPEYEPIVNERHEDYPSDYDYQEQSPEQLLRQENTRKVFNMAKNSETEKALKMNESSGASDIKLIEIPEKNNLIIKFNNDEVILRKGAEIIFKHDGESYSSKVYGIRGNDISVKYRGKKITINSKDIKKIY